MSSAPRGRESHPPGLYVLSATEAWERFSFYSVDAMLVLYLTDAREGFGWNEAEAMGLRSWYVALVYASPLAGGWIADRFRAYLPCVFAGAAFFMVGHLVLALPTIAAVYAGLGCLVAGNGLFKPNVSTMVGGLYSTGSKLKDRAYSIFYMGINVGAMGGPIVCELLQHRYGFHRAFNAAAAGMAVSVIILYAFRRLTRPRHAAEPLDTPVPALGRHPIEDVPEWKRVLALVLVYLVGIVFWMVFWQNGSTLALWARDHTDWSLFTDAPVTGIIAEAINPTFIILLGFPLTWLWRWLDARGLEPSTPTKMALGLVLAACSSGVLLAASLLGGNEGRVSVLWLMGSYFCISIAEILLSAMGLSLVSKVAPPRYRALLMGGWFVSLSLGGKLSAISTYWSVWPHSTFFAVLAALCLGAALLFFVMLRFLRSSLPGV